MASTSTRRQFLASAGATAAALGLGVGAARAASAVSQRLELQPSRPNILQIILDDTNDWLSWLGAPEPLQNRYVAHTPNLERLAARSVRFTNAHTPIPKCFGARAALWTGLSPQRSGIKDDRIFTGAPTRMHPGAYEPVPEAVRPSFNPQTGTIAEDLHAAGYRQYFAGKIDHCYTPDGTFLPHMTDLTRWEGLTGWHEVREATFDAIVRTGTQDPPPTRWFADGPIIDEALADSAVTMPEPSTGPWHLCVGLVGQHDPLVAKTPFTNPYRNTRIEISDESWDLSDIDVDDRPNPDRRPAPEAGTGLRSPISRR